MAGNLIKIEADDGSLPAPLIDAALAGEAMFRCRSAAQECGSKGFCAFGSCDMEMDPPDAPPDAEDVS